MDAREVLATARILKARVLGGELRAAGADERLRAATSWLVSADHLSVASSSCRRAFWINVYNTLVIHGALRGGLCRGGASMSGAGLRFFSDTAYEVNGRAFSLDDIEHGVLRGNRGHPKWLGLKRQLRRHDPRRAQVLPLDPRIHFALNCGAASCPPIRAYTEEDLDAQLELASRVFLTTTTSVDWTHRRVTLSRLFLWYRRDFGRSREQRLAFVARYIDDAGQARCISTDKLRVRYAPYDWSFT